MNVAPQTTTLVASNHLDSQVSSCTSEDGPIRLQLYIEILASRDHLGEFCSELERLRRRRSYYYGCLATNAWIGPIGGKRLPRASHALYDDSRL